MIVNKTCFQADLTSGLDRHGDPYLLVVVTASFRALPQGGGIEPLQSPGRFNGSDVYFGEPNSSSVKFEADTAPEKAKVDVIVIGRACAPAGHVVDRVKVALRVADIHKELMVTGDRHRSGILGSASRPRPFAAMPLVYERALGGTVVDRGDVAVDMQNPVGLGHLGAKSADPAVDTAIPNIVYADGRAAPAGFGVVARQWQPRLSLAGTYDDAWRAKRWPLLPHDFQDAYFQAVPADQQSDLIRGGEAVDIENMTPEGNWRFRLPTLRVPVHCLYADRIEPAELKVDTVVLQPESYSITLKARAKLVALRRRAPILQVVVGAVTPGWLRAISGRKRYWDPRRSEGTSPYAKGYVL